MSTAAGARRTARRAPVAPPGHTAVEYLRPMLVLAALAAAPFTVSPYWLAILNQTGIAVIGATGLNILVGFTGQISLGQGGFLAVGAYTSGLLAARAGLPFPADILCAVLVTTAVGTLAGLPAARLKGLYLAIATLASQQIILWTVTHWHALTGGTSALAVPPATLLGRSLNSDLDWYWVIAACAALSLLTAAHLLRSGTGRALTALRGHGLATQATGIDPLRYKLLAFAISSAFAGLAGALTARYNLLVTWEPFTLNASIFYLAIIIIGGLGSVSGAVYGAAFMTVVPAWIAELSGSLTSMAFLKPDLPAVQQLIFGLTVILFLIFEPRGIAQIWQRTKNYFLFWPCKY